MDFLHPSPTEIRQIAALAMLFEMDEPEPQPQPVQPQRPKHIICTGQHFFGGVKRCH